MRHVYVLFALNEESTMGASETFILMDLKHFKAIYRRQVEQFSMSVRERM